MKLEALGEEAFMLRDLGRWEAWRLCDAIGAAGIPGVVEAVSAYDTVAVYVDLASFNREDLLVWTSKNPPPSSEIPSRMHRIPVCYDLGEDTREVSSSLGLRPQEIGEIHCSVVYKCYALGFSPGFPYLGHLPQRLSGVPRRASPRLRVPAGSVAVTGTQTGVYPQEMPGGWALIGRTPLELVDVGAGYFPIAAGDTVAFEAIDELEFRRLEGRRL